MQGLRQFLERVKIVQEQPIEPDLKPDKQKKDRAIREEQDLHAGAVLEAVVAAGQGSVNPQTGDLVYVHVSISDAEGDLLHTTWAEDGGSGQPLVFMLEKGWRAPRSWELALLGMTRGMRKRLRVQPSYGFRHPDCKMAPPPGVAADQVLQFDLQLANWYPGDQVRALGEESSMFKRVLRDSDKWEAARAPNEVTLSLEARTPAYDGQQLSGFCYHTISSSQPLTLQLGSAALPPGLEAALGHITKGERAVFVLPAEQMSNTAAAGASSSSRLLIPDPPVKARQVELCLELHDLVQVRDVTGDGGVTKKRLREGSGEFPVDCPLHDTRVSLHYRLRSLAGGSAGPWLWDSRHPDGNGSSSSSSNGDLGSGSGDGDGSGGAAAVEVDTGCGELPDGLELALKLMVPGETASAVCQPKYAYQGRSDAPPGLAVAEPVEFEVVLVSFEREGYWQHMSWEERWQLAERLKEKGKQLFRDKKYNYAANRYTHLLRLIESTRDFDDQEQLDKADSYKATLLSNMALVTFQQGEYARSSEWCDKALQMEPDNAKVLFRKGKALSMKGDYAEAEEYLAAASELDSSLAADVEAARAANKQREQAAEAKQRKQFKNFFSKT